MPELEEELDGKKKKKKEKKEKKKEKDALEMEGEEEEKLGSKILLVVVTLVIILIWLAIFGLLVSLAVLLNMEVGLMKDVSRILCASLPCILLSCLGAVACSFHCI